MAGSYALKIVCKEQSVHVKSQHMCDDTAKLCAIADGMCVGQCEGLTFYKVAVDGSVQIVQVIIHNRPRPECVRIVVGLYRVSPQQTKHNFRSARVLLLVDADGYSPGLGSSIPMQSTMLVVDSQYIMYGLRLPLRSPFSMDCSVSLHYPPYMGDLLHSRPKSRYCSLLQY